MNADLLLCNIGELWTQNAPRPVKGAAMNACTVLRDAFVAVADGRIVGVGTGSGQAFRGPATVVRDLSGRVVVPGFVDGHTHLVHAGSREHELALKLAGVPYLTILERGGGILSTVAATRAASEAELYEKAERSLSVMIANGVTAVEIKSGYGLDPESERKQLRVARKLGETMPVTVVSTSMGAHAIPPEFAGRRDEYVDGVVADLAPLRREGLADGVDVFCEAGVFTVAETRRILLRAKELGFAIRLHADEIVPTGGAGLAADLGAASAAHLVAVGDRDLRALAASPTVAELLPGTSFYLDHPYAPARALIEAGAAVAIASDYNPGSCPSENFQLVLQLAALKLKMTPSEILTAATANPAFHLGLGDRAGAIAVGCDADLVVLDVPNFPYALYHFGINHASAVYRHGRLVAADGKIVKEES